MPATTSSFSEVPLPEGATRVCDWYDTNGTAAARYFHGKKWCIDQTVVIDIDGTQYAGGGTTQRFVNVIEDGYERLTALTADRAREIGLTLIAAADEIDRWAAK